MWTWQEGGHFRSRFAQQRKRGHSEMKYSFYIESKELGGVRGEWVRDERVRGVAVEGEIEPYRTQHLETLLMEPPNSHL